MLGDCLGTELEHALVPSRDIDSRHAETPSRSRYRMAAAASRQRQTRCKSVSPAPGCSSHALDDAPQKRGVSWRNFRKGGGERWARSARQRRASDAAERPQTTRAGALDEGVQPHSASVVNTAAAHVKGAMNAP